MKRIKLLFLSLLTAVIGITGVNAATIEELQTETYKESFLIEKNEETNEYTITLLATTAESIVIGENEIVTLDLKGHTLTNNKDVLGATVTINAKGALTVKDTGELGSITRVNAGSEDISTMAVIDNQGSLNLAGGFITPQVASTYGIKNYQGAVLNVTGGRVSIIYANTYGLWNEGTANISGGQFDQSMEANGPCVVNATGASINITDGTFRDLTGNNIDTLEVAEDSEISITGGQFDYQDLTTGASVPQDVSEYLPEGYNLDSNGNVILNADYSTLDEILRRAKDIDASKYTEESITALNKAIEEAEAVDRNLTAKDQDYIDTVSEALYSAYQNLVELDPAGSAPETNTTPVEDETPNTFDDILFYIAVGSASTFVLACVGYLIKRKMEFKPF